MKKGHTLIELIIVTLILSVLSGIALHLVAAGFNSWFLVAERRLTTQQSRTAITHLVRMIQGDFARGEYHSVDTWIPSFPPLNSELTFCKVSSDNDGYAPWSTLNSARYTFDYPTQTITYRQYNGLTWPSRNLETVLSTTVALSSLRYFDKNDVEIPASSGLTDAQTAAIWMIEINITNQLPSGGGTFTTKTRVFPRNEGRSAPP